MARRLRPDLRIELLRGNVQTRLAKLKSGEVDATILALAGLNRLGLAGEAASVMDTEGFLPAVAQGAIALVVRDGDAKAMAAAKAITHAETTRCVAAERAFLTVLDGSCRTPIAAYATLDGGQVSLRGLVLSPDGKLASKGPKAALTPWRWGKRWAAGSRRSCHRTSSSLIEPMRVLVTRPIEDADRTSEALAAAGHEALIAPLFAVAPLPHAMPADADALVATSANAIRQADLTDTPDIRATGRSMRSAALRLARRSARFP